MSHSRALAVLALLALAACTDRLTDPAAKPDPGPGPTTPPRPLGIYEIQIAGIDGSGQGPSASKAFAVPAGGPSTTMNPLTSGGFGLEFVSSGQFTDGVRGQGGHRYLYATYRVRNNTAAPVTNLTFIPVVRANTVAGTPFSQLALFNGTAASPTIAPQMVPTGAVALGEDGSMRARFTDVLQVFTEAEVAAITLPAGTTGIFPYGFVTTNPGSPNNRTLPVATGPNDWGGMVTFAFRYPMQATSTADPYNVVFQVLAVEDTETRMTESMEEAQDTAAVRRIRERATALGATTVTVLNGSGAAAPEVPDYPGQRQICSPRTAGTAGAPATTINAPASYATLALYYPGESLNGCNAYFRAGTPARPATNVEFTVSVRALDRYGNLMTAAVDSVELQSTGGPAFTTSQPRALVSGARGMSIRYSAYGMSDLRAVGRRNRGSRNLLVAGVTRTWTGGAGTTDWHTNGNWNPGAVPMVLDSVLVPLAAPLDPVIASNVSIAGVTVEDGATLSLSAFDLTASGNVVAGLTGGITNTTGRLVLSGTARTVQGRLPRLRVTGSYTLTGNVHTRAPLMVEAGRLTDAEYRLQVESF